MTTSATQKRGDQSDDAGDGRKKPHIFTIIVNNQEFSTQAHQLTGLEIKALAGIPGDYELFAVHGGNSVPVANDEVVHVHERIEFRAIPAGTFGASDYAAAAPR